MELALHLQNAPISNRSVLQVTNSKVNRMLRAARRFLRALVGEFLHTIALSGGLSALC